MEVTLNTILAIKSKFSLVVTVCFCLTAVIIGFYVIGPFFESEMYRWFQTTSIGDVKISKLLDVKSMLIEKLITSFIPIFMIWSILLTAFRTYPQNIAAINASAKLLSLLTSGALLLLVIFSSIIIGLQTYMIITYGDFQLLYLAIPYVAATVYLIYITRKPPKFQKDHNANWLVGPLLIFCILFVICAYTYSLVSTPLEYWNLITELYEKDNN